MARPDGREIFISLILNRRLSSSTDPRNTEYVVRSTKINEKSTPMVGKYSSLNPHTSRETRPATAPTTGLARGGTISADTLQTRLPVITRRSAVIGVMCIVLVARRRCHQLVSASSCGATSASSSSTRCGGGLPRRGLALASYLSCNRPREHFQV